jgi:hypothetical protein
LSVLIAGAVVVTAGLLATLLSVGRHARAVEAGVAPISFAATLPAGQWEFYAPEPTDTMSQDKVIVNPARGRSIVLVRPAAAVTATRTYDGTVYHGQLVFSTPSAGVYDIDVQTPETQFVIARTYGSSLKRAGGWLTLTGGGVLVMLVGLALFIVRASRIRRLATTSMYADATPPQYEATDYTRRPIAPPPGWYPDPGSDGSGARWWDGSRWTDHTYP